MLDLEALVGEMHGLAASVAGTARESIERRELGARFLAEITDSRHLREAVQEFAQDMALPTEGGGLSGAYPAPPAPDYTVIATDGSQIEPDPHHIAPWYVINIGCAVLRYGIPGRERFHLASKAKLRPPTIGRLSQELETELDSRPPASGPPQIALERIAGELRLALALLESEFDPGHTVLLLDGPLVQWPILKPPRTELRQEVIELFRQLLAKARETQTPIAGYISRSRAVEWVTLLRFSRCDDVRNGGFLCPDCRETLLKSYHAADPRFHHAQLAGLRDIDLARGLFGAGNKGARTDVLELVSKSWKTLAGDDADAAGFFYLDTGPEMARVEIPEWVWKQPELLDRVHAVLWDQCRSGRGYPMVLSEAHEAAVVRGADRDAFYTLIERVLIQEGVDEAATSAKALSKRRPPA